MDKNPRHQRNMERLEERQRRAIERLERQRQRIDEHYERMRRHVGGQPSDRQGEIITAALKLLDKDGLEGLSLRKLATSLGMQAPALYWHFRSKEDLIDHLAEAILRQEFTDFTPRTADEPWEEWLLEAAKRLRRAMRSHREGGRVVAGAHLYPAITLARYSDTVMTSLHSAEFSLAQARVIIMTITHFIFGRVIEEQSGPDTEQLKEFMQPANMERFEAMFPAMAQVVHETQFTEESADRDFETSIRIIIAGVKADPVTSPKSR